MNHTESAMQEHNNMKIWQKILIFLSIGSALLGILYRKTLYLKIPVVNGESYGLGDLIDGAFAIVVIAAAVSALVGALMTLIVSKWKSIHHSGLLALAAIVSLSVYFAFNS